MEQSVLVTGASGLIGTAVLRALRAGGRPVRVFARPASAPRWWQEDTGIEVVAGDVRDRDVLRAALVGIDTVIHLAAQTSHRVADADARADWAVNVAPLVDIIEDSLDVGGPRAVLLAGTESQVGAAPALPVTESTPLDPTTVYDVHKCAAEQLLRMWVARGALRGATLRLPTVYGPGPRERAADRGMVGAVIRRALQGGPLTVFGTGAWRRDYLHCDDAAAAFLAAMRHIDALEGRPWMVATGTSVPVATAVSEIAEAVAHRTGTAPVPVAHAALPAQWRAVDARDVVVDPTAFRARTGWRHRWDLRAGLASTVAQVAAETSDATDTPEGS